MTFKHVYTRFIMIVLAAGLLSTVSACKKDKDKDKDPVVTLPTSPLYDTLGWFIQGATGSVEGQGTKMIADPANPGSMIQAGRLAIRTVVDTAIFVIAADPQMQPYFPVLLAEVSSNTLTGFLKLEKNLTDFIQEAVSGQKVYTGLSMKDAHNHATHARFGSDASPETRKVNAADFDRFVADVAMAATQLQVPGSVTAQLGALLYTTQPDIVQR